MKKKIRRYAIRNYPGIFLVPLFTMICIAITLWMAFTGQDRVTWMALVSLASIFATIIVRAKVRLAYKTLRNHHARRKIPGKKDVE